MFRAGEQEQTPPEGFESSGSETVLGTEVKYDTPITRTITSANIDRLRFTFGVQALVETTSKGDRNPSEVRLLVQIQRNGGWVTEKDITIKGKTTSQYLASVVVGNLPPRPFNIRMRRMTPDSTTDQLQNKTLWSSYTEIIDVKQCYPNTALVGVQVDSEQFGSQQVSRNYHLRGRILQVPSNYNPQTRQYSGIWDGTLKPAYSNNMAWCLWDMLTHPRYGMGKRLGAADVDKWALYVIGQNCDQSVPDGFGGTEPRITCNAYLTTQRKAWDVLSDFCSAMRCMPVWNGQTLTFVQDRPSDKVWTYNRSNVVMPDDGAPFRYSFSALKDRHNAVEVNWIDPDMGTNCGTLSATAIWAFMFFILSKEELLAWGWRIPFLASVVVMVFAIWLRMNLKESPVFEKVNDSNQPTAKPAPAGSMFQSKSFWLATGLRFGQAGNSGLIQTFLAGYLVQTLLFNKAIPTDALMISSILGFMTIPFLGWLSDKIGRRIPYIIMNTSAIVLAWPMLSIIVDKSYAPSTIMVALIVIHNCAVLGLFALENITMAEMFGCKNRFTRMAISKEIGGLIASGFGPILAGIFCTMTESWYPIAIMIMAYSVIGLISALKMPEVKDRDLSALEDAAEDQPRVVRAAQPSRSL